MPKRRGIGEIRLNLIQFSNGFLPRRWWSERFFSDLSESRIRSFIKLGFIEVKNREGGRLSYRITDKGQSKIDDYWNPSSEEHSVPDIKITIQLQANTASIIATNADGLGKVGQVKDYQGPADLVPVLENLISELETLELPDIETTTDDKVTFYGGYQSWQPADNEWGFNEPDYTAPSAKKKSSKKTKKSKAKAKPVIVFKPPFTLWQDGKPRTLQLIDDFDISLEYKDNKSLKFDKQADAERVAQVLATQDNIPIVIQDKSNKTVSEVNPVKQKAVSGA